MSQYNPTHETKFMAIEEWNRRYAQVGYPLIPPPAEKPRKANESLVNDIEREVMLVIDGHITALGSAPTPEFVSKRVCKSVPQVNRYVTNLIKLGYLRRGHTYKTLTVVRMP